jgi:hypothetical protein
MSLLLELIGDQAEFRQRHIQPGQAAGGAASLKQRRQLPQPRHGFLRCASMGMHPSDLRHGTTLALQVAGSAIGLGCLLQLRQGGIISPPTIVQTGGLSSS